MVDVLQQRLCCICFFIQQSSSSKCRCYRQCTTCECLTRICFTFTFMYNKKKRIQPKPSLKIVFAKICTVLFLRTPNWLLTLEDQSWTEVCWVLVWIIILICLCWRIVQAANCFVGSVSCITLQVVSVWAIFHLRFKEGKADLKCYWNRAAAFEVW